MSIGGLLKRFSVFVIATMAASGATAVDTAAGAFHAAISVSHAPAQPATVGTMSIRLDFSGDRVPARAAAYVPLGYELALAASPVGQVIGSASASTTANVSFRGDIVLDTVTAWGTHPCVPFAAGGHVQRVWVARLRTTSAELRVPVFVDVPNRGSTRGDVYMARIETCFPASVAPSTQGVAPGVVFRSLYLDLHRIARAPAAGSHLWYMHALPFLAGTGTPAFDERVSVEARGRISFPTVMTLSARRTAGARRFLLGGRTAEAGRPVAGVRVEVFEGRRRVAQATTGSAGTFAAIVALKKGRHALRALARVGARVANPMCPEVSPFALNWPFVPAWERGRPCVSDLHAFFTLQARRTVIVP